MKGTMAAVPNEVNSVATGETAAIRWLWLALGVLSACGQSRSVPSQPDGGARDPDIGRCKQFDPLRQPYFGDLHVHTALSLDADLQGTRLRPRDAYRFARGETVGLPPYDDHGEPRRELALARPLDFVAVTDHAEFIGLVTTCVDEDSPSYDSDVCRGYREEPDLAFITLNARLAASQGQARYSEPCTRENEYCGSAALAAWSEVIDAADQANDDSDACAFTAFIGYEWSGSPNTNNLHRNVLFRGAAVPRLPFSYFDGSHEEQLWQALEQECLSRDDGCDVLTIPHNSNLSAGLMFEPLDKDGQPIDAEYAQKRALFEPLVEIFQHKGSSECLPEMGPDELCAFEVLPYTSLSAVYLDLAGAEPVPSDYVRHALGQGLSLWQTLGANPFQYGFVGSTDTHFGTSGAVSEARFAGHGGAGSNARDVLPAGLSDNPRLNPGGLAVLWAEENSRAALFDAMRRREAYGTSGPRIVLRFFGGFDYDPEMCTSSTFAEQGYEGGVPMGGELGRSEPGEAPAFAVWAVKDPGTDDEPGVDLSHVQIIKGYLEGGEPKYAIFDVAGDPQSEADVDPESCVPRGEGHAELCSVFRDPDFDPDQPAFYYARVLENPSCRWQTRVCRQRQVNCADRDTVMPGLEGCCIGLPETQRERAWSSPIFYRP